MKKILMCTAIAVMTRLVFAQSETMVYELKCNRQINPINIDDPHPSLSWKTRSQLRNYKQTAYQVIVASDSLKLSKNIGDLWKSNKVDSDQNLNIEYKGVSLKSNQIYWWKVKVWGNRGDSSSWSSPHYWRVSILDVKDWKGNWIGSDLQLNDLQKQLKAMADFNMEIEDSNWVFVQKLIKMPKEEVNAPAVYLRKEYISVEAIKSAFATISGLGFYELYINGSRISDEYLNPAFSDYQKRVFYNTYDVTSIVKKGRNAIGVILGNGWYNLIIPHVLRFQTADYIEPPALKMELRITYTDGSTESIITDKSWKFTTDGPIRFNCILGGETYDNTRNIDGWNKVEFDDTHWKNALISKAPEGKTDAQDVYPVRKTATNQAKSITYKHDTILVDFGLELTGWARVKLRGKKGQTIQVAYPGSQSHTLGRYQTCRYIFNGDPVEVFESRFSYNGFNKIEITGLNYKPDLSDFTAISVNTDMPVTGTFECSNDTINRLHAIITQTIKNYVVHLPNDPTREKAAWSQDIQNAFEATAYNFDSYSLYRKWQLDFLDIQHENGYVPPVVPGRFDGPTINCPWWGGMIVYQPWKIYEYYADKRILEDSYPAMKKYLDFLLSISNNYIISWGLGDWLEPGTVRPIKTPVPLTSTLGFYYYATIVEKTAGILKKNDERDKYRELAAMIKKSYNKTFYDQETGKYAKGSQASQLMSLCLGAVPQQDEQKVLSALISQIEADNMHLSTGFVSTPFLLNGLNNLGFPGIAYTIATQNTYPSWFDMVFNHGHNVLNEHWDGGAVQMPSLGGGIGSWFYASLAGLKPDFTAPGFKHMIIEPAYSTPLTYVKCSYQTLYGDVKIYWKKDKDRIFLELEIPENTKARVAIPTSDITNILDHGSPVTGLIEIGFEKSDNGKYYLIIGSGKYKFSMPFKPMTTDGTPSAH